MKGHLQGMSIVHELEGNMKILLKNVIKTNLYLKILHFTKQNQSAVKKIYMQPVIAVTDQQLRLDLSLKGVCSCV